MAGHERVRIELSRRDIDVVLEALEQMASLVVSQWGEEDTDGGYLELRRAHRSIRQQADFRQRGDEL
jgi:hypothetical protein